MMGIFRQDSRRIVRADALKKAALLAITLAGLAGFPEAAQAQGVVRSVHQDWQIRCDTPPGAQGEQCALMQSVVAEDRSNMPLTVMVVRMVDDKSLMLRVVAPLGILLTPHGLGLFIDNVDMGRTGFTKCLPLGCIADVPFDDDMSRKFRNAKVATFTVFQTPEEGIGFPISMRGFGEGFDKLR